MKIKTYSDVNLEVLIPKLCIGAGDGLVILGQLVFGIIGTSPIGAMMGASVFIALIVANLIISIVLVWYCRGKYFKEQRVNVLYENIDFFRYNFGRECYIDFRREK